MMKNQIRWLLASGLLALVIGLPIVTQSMEQGTNFQEMVKNAKTKADHEAVAALYEQEAKTLQEKAEQHQRLADRYGSLGSYETVKGGMVAHCNAIARKYQEAAEETLALAKLHRKMAAQVQQ